MPMFTVFSDHLGPVAQRVFSPLCDARREARRADVNFDTDRVNYS
jgi:hypothetical protein|tara:strand:+ start:1155 stop:1289 length:135 start_codon:yes stop_codon:yes gene_type:complete